MTDTQKNYHLSDFIDIDELRAMMQSFYDATGIAMGVCDADFNWLVAMGWKDICTKFHRVNPVSCQKCLESDRYIEQHLEKDDFVDYVCKHGLVDAAFPIIVDGVKIGAFFTGQFLYSPPDKEFFRQQAIHYGYDTEAYLKALEDIQIIDQPRMRELMHFFMRLVTLITRISHENLGRKAAEIKLKHLNENLEVLVAERTQELEIANKKLKRLAEFDELTGIANRRHFEGSLQGEIERCQRYHRGLSLIMLDLDFFKQINDNYGHDVGDQVLKETASALACCMRENDHLARWGGEEFLIILPETNLKGALEFAELIRQRVMKMEILPDKRITCSLGVAEWHNESGPVLFKRADNAVYTAKNNGRNRVEVG